MNTSTIKLALLAAAIALAPAAQAQEASRDTGVGAVIAEQGNAALRTIREEMRFPARGVRPAAVPARPPIAMQLVSGEQRPNNAKPRA